MEPIRPTDFRPDLPEPLERLILSMIHKKSESRPTAAEVASAIEAFREQEAVGVEGERSGPS